MSHAIEPRQFEIDAFLSEHFPPKSESQSNSENGNGAAWHPSDDGVLEKAFAAKNGKKVKNLFDGDMSEYNGDESRADYGLCHKLAFWAADTAQIDRLFRRSGLMRPKWDERRGDKTYGEMTIEKAWADQTDHYNPHRTAAPYGVESGCIVHYRQTKDAVVTDVLCNFAARIKEEIILDDGAETTQAFVIEGRLESGNQLPAARVPVAKFATMSWVIDVWGRRAIVNAGPAAKDHLRVAIQKLSPDAHDRHTFTHTGWRTIKGKWIYLSCSTAGDADFNVDLGTDLARYKLPSIADDPVGCMKLSLQLLDLAPYRITAPLFAACYRAPLCVAYPQDLSIWLEGQTGSMKSTLAAVFLNHFGEFDRTTLPGNWESTSNQLEKRAFILKDSVFVIDEYVPTGINRRDIETKASRILRAQGNLSGRNRLRSDLTDRPAYHPRGIIVSTGEQHPAGQSLAARTVIIEMNCADVDLALLTKIQSQTAMLSHAMAGYIAWLGPQMDEMPRLLRETFLGARTRATKGAEHLRIPEAAAHLWLGLRCGMKYAEEIGAISPDRASEILAKGWETFLHQGSDQAIIVEEERPVKLFLNVLCTLFTQGRGLILEKDDNPPEPKPGVDFLGWYDSNFLYLLPDATYLAVVRFCRDSGEHFPSSQNRLKRDLAKDGISECDPGRLNKTVKIQGHTKRVLKLKIQTIEKLLGVTGITGATSDARSQNVNNGDRERRDAN
jgi:hypothetical protein